MLVVMQIFFIEIKWKTEHINYDRGGSRTKIHRKRTFIMAPDKETAMKEATRIKEENEGKFWSSLPPSATVEVFGPGDLWSEPVVDEAADE